TAQRALIRQGYQTARTYSGGARSAARQCRQTAHRDPATGGDEPDRPDRADDDQRRRPRVPEGHSGAAEEFAGPVQFREYRTELAIGLSPSLRGAQATKQSMLSFRGTMDCFAEPVIGRAF